MTRKKRFFRKYLFDILAVSLIISLLSVYFITLNIRTSQGEESYFLFWKTIAINDASNILLSTTIFGYIISKILVKANKKGLDKWDFVAIFLMVLTLSVYLYTLVIRTQNGLNTYYSNPWIVGINDISADIFGSLLLGLVLGTFLQPYFKKI